MNCRKTCKSPRSSCSGAVQQPDGVGRRGVGHTEKKFGRSFCIQRWQRSTELGSKVLTKGVRGKGFPTTLGRAHGERKGRRGVQNGMLNGKGTGQGGTTFWRPVLPLCWVGTLADLVHQNGGKGCGKSSNPASNVEEGAGQESQGSDNSENDPRRESGFLGSLDTEVAAKPASPKTHSPTARILLHNKHHSLTVSTG